MKSEFNVGSNISCIKKSPFDDNIIATGGKDNDLKVWNISNEPEKRNVFRAKNVADNWVLLREPVWVMCIDFLSENKIVIGTAHHQV
jgi:ribosome biogenesis protein NSA1